MNTRPPSSLYDFPEPLWQGRAGAGRRKPWMPTWWSPHRNRLGRLLLGYIMLFSAVVSLLGTGVQLLTDFHRDVQALDERLEEIRSSYARGLSESLWELDDDLTQIQLEGIASLPSIAFVEVESTIGLRYQAGHRLHATRERIHTLALRHNEVDVGTLRVSTTLDDTYAQLRSRVLVILMTQAAKTSLLALFILFLFQYLVTQHLATMAAYARGLKVNQLGSPLVLHHKALRTPPRDELEEVVAAINDMRCSLQAEISERQRTEAAHAFLAEAGAVLMESLDLEKILPRIATLCVRSIAAWCVIDLVEGREVRRVGGAHADAARLPLLDELQRNYKPARGSKAPAATVLQTGQPLLMPNATEAQIRATSSNEHHFQLLRGLGVGSYLAVPLIARGQMLGAITLASGSRERVYGPAELELAQELARRAAICIDNARLYHRAEQATRLREVFLSVAAHELRTPLLPLQLRLQSLLRKHSQEGSRVERGMLLEDLTAVALQTKRIARLVDQLIDVSSLTAGNPLELRRKRVELCELVEGVVGRMQQQLNFSGSRLVQALQRPAVGWWDPPRIEQVVMGLLHNALKFGQGQPIEVSVTPREGSVLLVVRDHGIGMSEAAQARIFDKFARDVSEQHFGGLGLGLYVARWIIEAHGGRLTSQSQPGQGSTFTVELPAETAPGETG
jgi:signal transduction histidine kinase